MATERSEDEKPAAACARLVHGLDTTDPSIDPDAPEYRQVFATEADSPAKAVAKIRPLASGRRLRGYLAAGHYSDQLAEARWVA